MSESQALNTEMSVIAFIDLLGATELIRKENHDEQLNIIHRCYQHAIEEFNTRFASKFPIPKIKIFSDNIVLSLPCGEPDIKKDHFAAYFAIIVFCSYLLTYFWTEKLLLRGAVTVGPFFSDELMVWGKGLIRAYELENSIAIYPRIIIDPNFEELFVSLIKPETELLHNDYDGIFFINPFKSNRKETWKFMVEEFATYNWERLQNLKPAELKTRQKLNWLQKYFEDKLNH